MEKKRLDLLLYERGLFDSREKAKAAVMEGIVYIDGQKADKPGTAVLETVSVEVRKKGTGFVSRGGLKLQKALSAFQIDPAGLRVIDIGASTGGFTDCLLQRGAAHVYAIDVGYGQLAWSLRTDERVTCMERTNIRYVQPEQIGEPVDLAVCDVSFISLSLVLPAALPLLKPEGEIATLIKPQFEAGREKVGKKGVVRDPKVHLEVLEKIKALCDEIGISILNMTYSPIKGPEGNIEFLAHLKKKNGVSQEINLEELVMSAHQELDKTQK